MDKKIIYSLLSNVLIAYSAIFAAPVTFAILVQDFDSAIFFSVIGICVVAAERSLKNLGRGHKRRLPLISAATSMLLTYPLLAAFGFLPFVYFGVLPPVDALLETVADLTSAGISLMPSDAPYILRLWQSLLMWFGSLIFLVILVTVMPTVSGNFGMTLSLHGGQNFSPIFGQMLIMAQRMIKVYTALTIFSLGFFKLAGLNFWDSFLMALRCISTGGGDFFPARGDIWVEYAAAFTMLMACGNFLFYHRLIVTLPPPTVVTKENFLRRGINYVKTFFKNFVHNVKHFFKNSEVKVIALIFFLGVVITMSSTYREGIFGSGSEAFRHAFFHVASFLSTTGISLESFGKLTDFDGFFIFFLSLFGGCMGSVTGGIKIMRVIVLAKLMAAELEKTMHPRMMTVIKVNKFTVPTETIGRILGFFFLSCVTLFICAAVLSFSGLSFSEAVAMSFSCLTNVGNLPGLCEPENFLGLPAAGKFFCMIILILGRLEIFVLLIFIVGLVSQRNVKDW
ncbi:MAG: TrkH family potassium uptake protein [Selenomonadaceae bacterium]|nr:TrkH family potassium uptake protein [Selenomonadaceae bacterium]